MVRFHLWAIGIVWFGDLVRFREFNPGFLCSGPMSCGVTVIAVRMFGFFGTNAVSGVVYNSIVRYVSPKNMKYYWNYGILSMLFPGIQLLSGVLLTMQYAPTIEHAFDSVEYILREVNNGWLLRSLHANGASFFFLYVYLHVMRGLYHRTYQSPRGMIWVVGLCIYVLLMGAAFLGYVLPWGQMSYWAATVITNLATVIPYVGSDLLHWLWGGYAINNATLNRFHTLHFLLPFVLAIMVMVHIYVLHQPGSSSELGVSAGFSQQVNKVTGFHAYYIVKDMSVCLLALPKYAFIVFLIPECFNHPDNYNNANPLVTPTHIVPEWYFLPFHGMLRSIMDKQSGILLVSVVLASFVLLPFYDPKFAELPYTPYTYSLIQWTIVCNFVSLGVIGSMPPVYPVIELGIVCAYIQILSNMVALPLATSVLPGIRDIGGSGRVGPRKREMGGKI